MGSVIAALLLALAATIKASPSISFPINSQVPPVARISKPFQFTFSASTFTSSVPAIDYSLSDSPGWLQIDSAGRTLFGTPGTNDEGPVIFHVVATDDTGAASLPVTLIVSAAQGPGLGVIASQQLPAFGTFSAPDNLLLYPSAPLSVALHPDTFTNTDEKTVYYALCANHTPLPSWINFDASRLLFTGIAPDFTSPMELPQYFGIELTASDVVGFSGAITSFQIIIESHKLTFNTETVTVNVSPGRPVNFSGILNNLTLDGAPVRNTDIKQILAETPDWLALDARTSRLSGTPPTSVASQNISIQVMDVYSNIANATLLISVNASSTLIQSNIGVLKATIGSEFSYTFSSSVFSGSDVQVGLDLGNTSSWLSYDSATRTLHGNVPTNADAQQDQLKIAASRGSQSESQSFAILLVQRFSVGGSTMTNALTPTTTTTPTPSTTPTTQPFSTGNNRNDSRRKSIVAGVVISIVALLGVGLLFSCLAKRRRRRNSIEGYLGTPTRYISRPIFRDRFAEQEDRARILEKPTLGHRRLTSKPPKLDICDLGIVDDNQHPPQALHSKKSADEISRGSKRDSWLRRYMGLPPVMSGALRPTSRTGSDHAFTAADESLMRKPDIVYKPKDYPASGTRGSRMTGSPSTKECSCWSKRYSDTSFVSHDTPFATRTSGLGHGKGGFDHLVSGSPSFGRVDSSWRDIRPDSCSKTMTSMTSEPHNIRSIVDSFPPPPASHSLNRSEIIYEDPATSDESNRLTIRPIKSFSQREKSFHTRSCRKRLRDRSNPLFSAGPSSRKSSQKSYVQSAMSSHIEYSSAEHENGSTNPASGHITSCNALPSLQPSPLYHTPRPQPPKSPSRFGIPFLSCRSQSSRSSLTSSQRFESAEESEAPSEFGTEDLLEEEEEGERRRRKHGLFPDPLRMHAAEARGGAVEDHSRVVGAHRGEHGGEHGAGDEGSTQQSSWLRAAGIGSLDGTKVVFGERGKRPVSVEAEGDLRRGRMAGKSLKGDMAFI